MARIESVFTTCRVALGTMPNLFRCLCAADLVVVAGYGLVGTGAGLTFAGCICWLLGWDLV